MKMKLTLVSLVFLAVGVLARAPQLTDAESDVAVDELNKRYARSASSESSDVTPGKHSGKSREVDLEAGSKEAGTNDSGTSIECESENSSETKHKDKSGESGEEKKRHRRDSSEGNKGGSKESSQSGGKSKESGENGGQLNGANPSGMNYQYAKHILKRLASILGINVSEIPDLVTEYMNGSLPVSIEALLKTLGVTTSLAEMQDTSALYQMIQNIPFVGLMVNFLTNTLSIPINIIAFILFLGTTIGQHIYSYIPSIL